jgi:type I restriction enzyme S subunit
MAEHSCIVAEVERRLSLLRETEVQVDVNLQRAERLRQSILSRAFSGGLIGDRETISADAAAGAA